MEDTQIIELYWQRQEQAITETDLKYGRLCFSIAKNILAQREDAEECVSDTYMAAWNAMPPKRPSFLSAFLSRIARNLFLKRYEYLTADKRNQNATVSLSELEDFLSGNDDPAEVLDNRQILQVLNRFLWKQKDEPRNMFLRRYWYFDSVTDIAKRYSCSVDKVSTTLYRTRNKLKDYLRQEGIEL